MGMELLLQIVPWVAVVLLSLGYWSQVRKIQLHKEVRDLSMMSYVLLAFGFSIMSWQAIREGSAIFLFKQVMTLIPVTIIIYQIVIHQGDTWHDEDALHCGACDNELEVRWSYCPACGEPREGAVMSVEAAEEQGMTLTVEEGELVQVGGVEMMSTNVPKLPVSSKDPVIHLHYQMPSSASLEKK
ncbi:MAG TPA: hypothetical protein DCE42_01605 [Myxococcales bacterium]|nr:hypothetical protein [Deltaproteobacteria bacterium]MBU50707.1 hypothetical protein [Deltaproteobacteria bacterium]HAA53419.1 hypothetical protein [Myxococcales bacterium]|tara:strand:+ start:63544 stop:64098 length:555 start_codon:yes stop_codon:yes gene_type:complete